MVATSRRRLCAALGLIGIAPRFGYAQEAKIRRLGVILSLSGEDPEARARVTALTQRLGELGWRAGKNLQIDYRFAGGDSARMPKLVKELLSLGPDVLFVAGTQLALIARQETLSTPIVFVQVTDPVSVGIVTNLGRPEGNATGVTNFPDISIAGKWLQVLKECVPGLNQVAIVFDPSNPSWATYVRAMEVAAPKFGIRLKPLGIRSAGEFQETLGALSKEPHVAFIVLPNPLVTTNRKMVVSLAERYRLPAIYPYSYFAEIGGLVSYGIDVVYAHREAATYVDRILRGTKTSELPVQQASKLELVVNLKTAKALGLKIPQSVLTLANRVIQ